MHNPKSIKTTSYCLLFSGLGLTNILPGWGSQWTNPEMNIYSANALITVSIIYWGLNPNFFISSICVIFTPSIHSETNILYEFKSE